MPRVKGVSLMGIRRPRWSVAVDRTLGSAYTAKTRRITISSPFAAHGPNVEPVDRHPSREAGVMKYYERWQRSWPQHKTLYFACNAPPHLDAPRAGAPDGSGCSPLLP